MNPTMRSRMRAITTLFIACIVTLFLATKSLPVLAQATITPNYKDADIEQIIEAVGAVTGKNFIIDPRVKAQVTMVSSTPMSAEAFYEAFLSILQVYGYVAVPSGSVIKILPDANARQLPGWEDAAAGNRRADDIVTKIVQVKNVAAAQLVPILRPLIPQYGHLAAHPASNMLIISDRSANVDRIMSIIRRIDQSSDEEYEVIRLNHASAAETVRVVSSLQQGTGAENAGRSTTVVADERTNSILISGDKADRLRLRTLIAHLDTPLEDGGDTRVRYLRYSDALDLATKLETQYNRSSGGLEAGPQSATDITIWADEQTNALVITAPPKTMRAMMGVIDKIDIRRAQVLVEAIIVEVSAQKTAELGITWAVYNQGTIAAATNFPNVTPGIVGLAGVIDESVEKVAGALASGANFGIGSVSDSGTSFVGLIQALEADADTNIMATPTLVTMDNEEAEINVGQEVPFVTGSYSNTGSADGSVNPFQTVEREQVGLTLKITPQINEGDAILLEIDQEVSSLASSTAAVDLITNNRTITTSVIVDDAGTLVLGGLIQDEMRDVEQRVPILGSLPLIGALFRATRTEVVKTNLMIFIKPTILRDNVETAYETNAKYRTIRNMQLAERDKGRSLIQDMSLPVLPELSSEKAPVLDLRTLPQAEPEEALNGLQEDTDTREEEGSPETTVIDLRTLQTPKPEATTESDAGAE
ncbi:MAG: type II secretion system secretin GspD [Gammaproteobacteria bacterium]|nr:type II secretion system secretin GspD [Gammaproteobacteria bacterium]MCP4088753.1 type II secretion system secretin GspD [Gammaproteobacteria bacterium]MCP4275948.1 type II secretion system secretin GspD [Gammaproteobacteria bacterium]MCP4832164.1 type II secretion system secretin GspD [Gammaproteobacteria bacterium]MCP4928235.1 type II secretion system secretin GspD [Gammaproteobacteria bacterium]